MNEAGLKVLRFILGSICIFITFIVVLGIATPKDKVISDKCEALNVSRITNMPGCRQYTVSCDGYHTGNYVDCEGRITSESIK
jgi:hypothetical protein